MLLCHQHMKMPKAEDWAGYSFGQKEVVTTGELLNHVNDVWPLLYLAYPTFRCSILYISNRSQNLLVCFSWHCTLALCSHFIKGCIYSILWRAQTRYWFSCFLDGLFSYDFWLTGFFFNCFHSTYLFHCWFCKSFSTSPTSWFQATIPAMRVHRIALHHLSSVAVDLKLRNLVRDVFLSNSVGISLLTCFCMTDLSWFKIRFLNVFPHVFFFCLVFSSAEAQWFCCWRCLAEREAEGNKGS